MAGPNNSGKPPEPTREPPILTHDGLEQVLAQANAEGWRELALLGPRGYDPARRAAELVEQGWPREHIFSIDPPLQEIPSALFSLTSTFAIFRVADHEKPRKNRDIVRFCEIR